jgi:hypothetical protein
VKRTVLLNSALFTSAQKMETDFCNFGIYSFHGHFIHENTGIKTGCFWHYWEEEEGTRRRKKDLE